MNSDQELKRITKAIEPKTDYETARDEAAEKRSLRQCTTSNEHLDKAVSHYLKIGFEDGSDFGAAYERERAEKLVENIRLKINKHAEAYGTDIFPDYNLSDTPIPSLDQVSGKMGRHMIQCFHHYLDEALAEYKGEVE